MSDTFLYFDDTDESLEYSADQWFDNSGVDRSLGIVGTFNNTLSSTTVKGATVSLRFYASQIAVIGATLAFPGTTEDTVALSSYILDGSKNNAFLFAGNATNSSAVTYYLSGHLDSSLHTLDITVISASERAPFLLDAFALKDANAGATQTVTVASTAVYTTTRFVTPPSAPTSVTSHDTANAAGSTSLPVGAIVGGTIGGVALLVAAALAFFFLYWRPRHGAHRYQGVGVEVFDSEKDVFAPIPVTHDYTSQVDPFVQSDPPSSHYSDHPPPPARSISSGPSAYSASVSASGSTAPHTYPPPRSASGSRSSASGSGAGSRTGALTVVNADIDSGTAAAVLTPAQRKAAEAAQRSDSQSVQYHADSGARFDAQGRPIVDPPASGSGAGASSTHVADVPELADVPPEYSET